MTAEFWQVAGGGFVANLLAVWALIQQANRAATARTDKRFDEVTQQFADVERRLREAQDIKGEVRTADRRLTDLTSRLDRLEGGISEQIRSVQLETSALGKQVAELRGELNIGGMVRGIFGARAGDKTGGASG